MSVSTITPNPAAQVYGAYAAPIATSAASVGATTTGGNTNVRTGYSTTPAANVTGGGGTAGGAAGVNSLANGLVGNAITAAQPQVLAATGQQATTLNQGQQAQVANAAANIATTQLQSASTSGGGAIGDALKSGVSNIVAFAQQGMADIQKAIQGDMAANNGEVPAAKMQLYTMKMSTYELLNQMAAKIQEKEERAIQVWLR